MVYYYQIHKPNDRQKTWLNTHAPILRSIFRRQPDQWQPSPKNQKMPVEYSDIDKNSQIKNKLNYRTDIAAKSYLANLLRNQTEIFPATLIIRGQQVEPTSKKALVLYQKNKPGKYYLKPDNGFAGKGIIILARPQDFKKSILGGSRLVGGTSLVKTRQLRKFSANGSFTKTVATFRPGDYVLQQGIQNLHLYPGRRKYEYRIWVLVAWQKSHSPNLKIYFYQDAVMRLTATAYQSKSLKAEGNITTSSYYYKDQGIYKSDLLSRQDYFEEVFPRAQEISKYVMKLIRPDLILAGSQGFEIFGFDFLNQWYTPKSNEVPTLPENNIESVQSEIIEESLDLKKLRPVLIEINRHIGYYTYPPGVHAPWVTEANIEMMRDLVEMVMVPMIENHPLGNGLNKWQQVLELS